MALERQRRLIEFKPTRNPRPDRWYKDDHGKWVMPELQSEFLDWLLSMEEERDEHERTEAAWAAGHGVAQPTVNAWKKNTRFRTEWTVRAAKKNISVDRLQNILDMLYRRAIVGQDTNAANRWLSWVEKYMPPVAVERDEEVAHLSDEELKAELSGLLEENLSDDEGSDE